MKEEKVLEIEKSYVIQDENGKILCVDDKTFVPELLDSSEVTINNLVIFTQEKSEDFISVKEKVNLFLTKPGCFRNTELIENMDKEKVKLVEVDVRRIQLRSFLKRALRRL